MKMENNINSLMISEKDSVAVALEELNEGDAAKYKVSDEIREIKIVQNVPIYHKFVIVDVKEGDFVYKYGQVIGKATQDIKIGQHLHTHNITGIREMLGD
ncbi:D-galactarate dehydratase [Clostridium polyendosporum]|uniref:D-galactarate dehydratase n=1 Tax=Clostridium polyendosporum TaxID=69208 RepID=A0A919RZ46_9CLOT|nr:UxaA family hydrolase [Clostridium polyendosporum]GIM28444.1 D-galactarate dehydratase [Clostridium polyendosporum]